MLREALERATRSWSTGTCLQSSIACPPGVSGGPAQIVLNLSPVDSQARHIKGTNTAAVAATGNTFKKVCRALLPADVSTTTTSPG
jgi:hypothetical protein